MSVVLKHQATTVHNARCIDTTPLVLFGDKRVIQMGVNVIVYIHTNVLSCTCIGNALINGECIIIHVHVHVFPLIAFTYACIRWKNVHVWGLNNWDKDISPMAARLSPLLFVLFTSTDNSRVSSWLCLINPCLRLTTAAKSTCKRQQVRAVRNRTGWWLTALQMIRRYSIVMYMYM